MNRFIAYDSTERGPLGLSWKVYANAQRLRGWQVIPAAWWHGVLQALESPIDELQIWGHGMPGEPLIAGEPPDSEWWTLLARHLTPNSLVWFRSCSTFFGERGRAFAERTANRLGCRIAGHTRIIGQWQSGLWTLEPGQTPKWAIEGGNWRDYRSSRTAPRTISCVRMTLPEWA